MAGKDRTHLQEVDLNHPEEVLDYEVPEEDMEMMRRIVGRLFRDEGVVSPEETARRLRTLLVASYHPEALPWTPGELERYDPAARIKAVDVRAVLDGEAPEHSEGRFNVCRNVCNLLGFDWRVFLEETEKAV